MQAMTVSVNLRAKDGISPVIERVNANLSTFENKTTKLAKTAGTFGAIGMGGALALGNMFAQPVKSAIAFESAMADVKKVLNFTPNTNEFKAFSVEILSLSNKIPLAASELATIAASGGQLGIAKDKIIGFTTVVAKMSTAFDMMPSQAGDSIAKLMNIYGLSIEEATSLGDAVNHLSDNSAAKASDMINVLSRTGGMAKSFGMSAVQVSALGSAFLAMGMAPEVASTSINAMLLKLSAANKQGKKFQAGLKSIGLSANSMQKMISRDANGAIMSVLEKLKHLDKQKQTGVLLDLFGMEYASKIALVVNGLDNYKKSLGLVADKQKYAGSMEREFQARSATTENQLILLKNSINKVAITIGSVLLPTVNKIVSKVKSVTEAIASWTEKNPELTKSIMKFGAITIGSLAGLSAFSLAVSAILFSVSGFTKVLKGGMWILSKFGRKGTVAAVGVESVATAMDAVAGKSVMARMGVVMPKKMSLIGKFKGVLAAVASYALANPIGLALTITAGAGMAAYEAYKYQQEHQGEASLDSDKQMLRQYKREKNVSEALKTVSTEQAIEAKIRQEEWRDASKKIKPKFDIAAKVTSISVEQSALDNYMASLQAGTFLKASKQDPFLKEISLPLSTIGQQDRSFTTVEKYIPAEIPEVRDRSFRTKPTMQNKAPNVSQSLQSFIVSLPKQNNPTNRDIQKVELKKPIVKKVTNTKNISVSPTINITVNTKEKVSASEIGKLVGEHIAKATKKATSSDNSYEDKE